MTILRFHADRSALPEAVEDRIIATDFEGTPWPSRSAWRDGRLCVVVDFDDSFYVQLPILTDAGHELMVTTTTLVPRESAYVLVLELLRGTLHRAMNLVEDRRTNGLELDTEEQRWLVSARSGLCEAAICSYSIERCQQLASQGLSAAVQLIELLSRALARRFGSSSGDAGEIIQAVNLGELVPNAQAADQISPVFDSVITSIRWKDIEAEPGEHDWQALMTRVGALQTGPWRLIAGPILNWQRDAVPDWIVLYEDDPDTILNNATEFVRQVVKRLSDRVQMWHAAAGMNCPHGLGLDEENRLRLAALVIDTVRSESPQTPIMVSVSQPWGEYLAHDQLDVPPIAFVDALVRAELGLSAIGLELELDYWPQGTVRRDGYELIRKLDQWARFNLPLVAILTAPSAAPADSRVTHRNASPATQADVARDWLPLLRFHPAVHGIVWNQWADAPHGENRFGGLIDSTGSPKLVLNAFQHL